MPFMPTRPHAPAHSRVRGEESCACSGVRSAEPLGSCGVCKACELFGAPKSLEYLQLGHTTRTRRVAHAVCLFRAMRHIGRKWATCTPSAP